MVIVPQELIERLKQQPQQQQQEQSTADSLDARMQRIMNDKRLDDSEKWKLYQQELQRSLHIASVNRQPIGLPIVGGDTTATLDEGLVDEVADTFSRNYRSDARKLLKTIARRTDLIRWDGYGNVYVRNEKIPDANIVDIMHGIVRMRRTQNQPPGWEQVMRVLKEINIPSTYIHNPDALEYLDRDPYPSSVSSTAIATSTPIYSPPFTRGRAREIADQAAAEAEAARQRLAAAAARKPKPESSTPIRSRPSRLSSSEDTFGRTIERWEKWTP